MALAFFCGGSASNLSTLFTQTKTAALRRKDKSSRMEIVKIWVHICSADNDGMQEL